VRLVIADTGPINYLVLIGYIDLLPALFQKVILPSAVQQELDSGETPPSVRGWVANPPVWVEVKETPVRDLNDHSLDGLDQGERAAIALAVAINADLLLMDDREGVVVARNKGFAVTGTLVF
jgi:predicted nucleic acid-binding protein